MFNARERNSKSPLWIFTITGAGLTLYNPQGEATVASANKSNELFWNLESGKPEKRSVGDVLNYIDKNGVVGYNRKDGGDPVAIIGYRCVLRTHGCSLPRPRPALPGGGGGCGGGALQSGRCGMTCISLIPHLS